MSEDRLRAALTEALGPAADDVARLVGEHHAAFVGGWVRDTLRGASSDDVDLCAPDPDALAAAFRTLGRRPVLLDPERRTWRIPLPVNFLDVSGFKGPTLDDDLRKRDLTVNAIAWVPGRGLVDPLDGQGDLAAGRLALTEPGAIEDDRLRAIRLWRFAATLGAVPTAEAVEAAAVSLDGVAGERVVVELTKLLAAEPVTALRGLEAAGLLAQVLPPASVDRLEAALSLEPDPGLDRCRRHVRSLPGGEVALRLGWLCAGPGLIGALKDRRWPRRFGPHAQTVGDEASAPSPGATVDDRADALARWGCRVAFALLGRAVAGPRDAEVFLAQLDACEPHNPKELNVPPLPRLLLSGHEVAARVGAGPATGAAVGQLLREQLAGRVTDVEAARRWLTAAASPPSS